QKTFSHSSQGYDHMAGCTYDKVGTRRTSGFHTEGRVLSCAACESPFTERVGRTKINYTINSLKPGDDCGIPWRVALALQAWGWVLRQDIIWYSSNKMPESVTNRCSKSHEHI